MKPDGHLFHIGMHAMAKLLTERLVLITYLVSCQSGLNLEANSDSSSLISLTLCMLRFFQN